MFTFVGVKLSVLDGYSCSLLKLVRQKWFEWYILYVEITYMLSVVFAKATRVFWRVLLVVFAFSSQNDITVQVDSWRTTTNHRCGASTKSTKLSRIRALFVIPVSFSLLPSRGARNRLRADCQPAFSSDFMKSVRLGF
jgi:hypothetical protein